MCGLALKHFYFVFLIDIKNYVILEEKTSVMLNTYITKKSRLEIRREKKPWHCRFPQGLGLDVKTM